MEECAMMLDEIHDLTLERIGAGESGYAIANVQKNGHAQDLSFHKGNRLVGTYHGGPDGLVNGELKEAMILSIAEGRIVATSQRPGAASPATFYKMDIVRMIRERRLRGDDHEAEVLERYRTHHPEVFVA
jgi:hypothetical protein